jgi:hypothetical protein
VAARLASMVAWWQQAYVCQRACLGTGQCKTGAISSSKDNKRGEGM